MIQFFQQSEIAIIAVGTPSPLSDEQVKKLVWLFSGATPISEDQVTGDFIGPRKEMISPWSTNATDIAHNAGISSVFRIESYITKESTGALDPMLQQVYSGLDQSLFTLDRTPAPIEEVEDIASYNLEQGLALSDEEIEYLQNVAEEIGRPLTDSEVFGFSQINSEHCRHKIFNGTFIIDGVEEERSLFQWIKKTSKESPNYLVSAYSDNVAFIQGPTVEQFAPERQDIPDWFETKAFESVISLKAETHNFPTTVEPFNGAATGSGGEIRDRMAGGQGSISLAGTAVYMTSYARVEEGRSWEKAARKWLYQSPQEILTKASNGASDYGNKFGQPLIAGSVLTFEYEEGGKKYGFDKVVMLAGGIGFGKKKDAKKQPVSSGEKIVVMGGDNYRIGMGGGAVSSVDTGAFDQKLELNAVQRSNPEMQKRVANAIRSMVELDENTITSIHDHGAGGHLNCLSELVEDTGGKIHLRKLPIGDETLSAKEILGNESQERMGLVIKESALDYLKKVSLRERAPFYEVGEAGDQHELVFEDSDSTAPFNLKLNHLFGSSPKTILEDKRERTVFQGLEKELDPANVLSYIEEVLQLEAVACKDWLTNKVDRCVTGKVATQQTCGELQLPLNNVGVMALDFKSESGIATSIGHAPIPALISPEAGSRLSITEALTNLVWAPLTHGLKGVSLSANWMWPAKNEGENARLYDAVKATSDFACALGINIPTGKDSMSMTQKYPDGEKVYAPGTVIISAVGEVSNIKKTVSPVINNDAAKSTILYVDFSGGDFSLGGSSLAQTLGLLGDKSPDAKPEVVLKSFEAVQKLINDGMILSGHDVSAGGLLTALLEMCFANTNGGLEIDLSDFKEDLLNVLFSEKPALLIQVEPLALAKLDDLSIEYYKIGKLSKLRTVAVKKGSQQLSFEIDRLRDQWMKTSYLMDLKQTEKSTSEARRANRFKQPLSYRFPKRYDGNATTYALDFERGEKSGVKAAIIREQGVNSDREMAYALWLAGFDVKDVHMTDLINGREDLSEIQMIVFVGGFSNSDVLGSAKGWAGSFLFNEKAKNALDTFYQREDTLSLGVCNGCQLMMELGLIYPELGDQHPKMRHNISGKFECGFINVEIQETNSVLLKSMVDSRLGIWLAHGEGRFTLDEETEWKVPIKYSYSEFPGNANGSDLDAAALCSKDGRHLAMMPHLERSLFSWNWPYKKGIENSEVSPWIEPFVNAFEWLKSR
ncbi:MAG: phosphoribosylformylglycinamidine synthase [Bacteroidota bacterium]